MANEYRDSLQKYESLLIKEQGLWHQGSTSEGRGVPNEEIITFMTHVKEAWPLMFAIEQRHFCREKMSYWLAMLNGQRKSTVLTFGDNYVGIFGQSTQTEGLFNADPLDYRVHEGKRVWLLNELECMADAVDKSEGVDK